MVTQCARVAMRGRLPEHGPVSITIQLYWKNRVHSDVDNCAKALLDGMQGVIFRDDKQVMELHVYGGYDKGAPRAEVTVEAWRESEGKAA